MSDREIMNAKFSKQQELLDDVEYKGDLGPKYYQVPFVDEVQEFNETFGKPNNYTPIIPEKKEWQFVYNFILEELEEYKEACEKGDTCVVRTSEQKEKCHWEKVGDRYVVYRTRDRKVMKSIDYFKPNLKQFFNEKN